MSKFKKKFGKRILAFLLSGAMIMSNMTAFASEPSQNTEEGYSYEQLADVDSDDVERTDETVEADEIVEVKESVEADETLETDNDNTDGNDDGKASADETVETKTSDDDQTSEMESSLSVEDETDDKTVSMTETDDEEDNSEDESSASEDTGEEEKADEEKDNFSSSLTIWDFSGDSVADNAFTGSNSDLAPTGLHSYPDENGLKIYSSSHIYNVTLNGKNAIRFYGINNGRKQTYYSWAEIHADAGDIITVDAAGTSGDIIFAQRDNEGFLNNNQPSFTESNGQFKIDLDSLSKDNTQILTTDENKDVDTLNFYAPKNGDYLIISGNEKANTLIISRITREHVDEVTVKGTVTNSEGSNVTEGTLAFTDNATQEATEPISVQNYVSTGVKLYNKHSYTISASEGLAVSDDTKTLDLSDNSSDSPTHDIKLGTAAPTATLTGKIIVPDGLKSLKITFTEAENPEETVVVEPTKTGEETTYSAKLKIGIAYTIKSEGSRINDYALDTSALGSIYSEDKITISESDVSEGTVSKDIEYKSLLTNTVTVNVDENSKDVYGNTITKTVLADAGAKLIFTHSDGEEYKDEFGINDVIKLRKGGTYRVTTIGSVYTAKTPIGSFEVTGENDTLNIEYQCPTDWDFTTDDFKNCKDVLNDNKTSISYYNGLKLSQVKKQNSMLYAYSKSSTTISIPVIGDGRITFSTDDTVGGCASNYTINVGDKTDENALAKSETKTYTYDYAGNSGYVDISINNLDKTNTYQGIYFKNIHITYAKKIKITEDTIANGSVTAGTKTTAFPGDTVKLADIATATAGEGAEFNAWKVTDKDGTDVSVSDNGTANASFVMPESDVTISAEFIKLGAQHNISIADAADIQNGTAEPATGDGSITQAAANAKVDLALVATATPAEPAENYALSKWEVTYQDADGQEQKIEVTKNSEGKYIFTMPDSDVTVKPVFVRQYRLDIAAADSVENGRVTAKSQEQQYAVQGDIVLLKDIAEATPANEYAFQAWKITYHDQSGIEATVSVTQSADGDDVFTMPDSNVTISAVFEPVVENNFKVWLDDLADENGTVAAEAHSYQGGTVTLIGQGSTQFTKFSSAENVERDGETHNGYKAGNRHATANDIPSIPTAGDGCCVVFEAKAAGMFKMYFWSSSFLRVWDFNTESGTRNGYTDSETAADFYAFDVVPGHTYVMSTTGKTNNMAYIGYQFIQNVDIEAEVALNRVDVEESALETLELTLTDAALGTEKAVVKKDTETIRLLKNHTYEITSNDGGVRAEVGGKDTFTVTSGDRITFDLHKVADETLTGEITGTAEGTVTSLKFVNMVNGSEFQATITGTAYSCDMKPGEYDAVVETTNGGKTYDRVSVKSGAENVNEVYVEVPDPSKARTYAPEDIVKLEQTGLTLRSDNGGDVTGKAGASIKVPVTGKAAVTIETYYEASYTVNGKEYTNTSKSTNSNQSDNMMVEGDFVIEVTAGVATTYFRKISVSPVTAYKSELNVPGDYDTLNEAFDAIASMENRPEGEEGRVTVNLNKDIREQTVLRAPYVTLKGNNHTVDWYYGVGTLYYSVDPSTGLYSERLARDRYSSAEGNGQLWGGAFLVYGDHFTAEDTTFKNTYNYELTNEEKKDIAGSTLSVSRLAEGADVAASAYKERSNAFYIGADQIECYNCKILSSQDTLGRNGTADREYHVYFRDCVIGGNVDYVCGDFAAVFDNCELRWKTLSDKGNDKVGYIVAPKTKPYVLRNCEVTTDKTVEGLSGFYGRTWGNGSNATFINTETNGYIKTDGWGEMSKGEGATAVFKEYGNTSGGAPFASTGSFCPAANQTLEAVKDYIDTDTVSITDTVLGGWKPGHYSYGSNIPVDPKVKITFMNGDQVFFEDEVSDGIYDLSKVDTTTLVPPTGKKFVGWGTTPDSKEIIETTRHIKVPSTGRTLYALFADEGANIYKVYFEGYDGEELYDTTVLEGATITFDGSYNERDRYTFVGWKLKGGEKVYKEGETYQVTGDVTFVETWEAKPLEKYTVTLVDENGKEIKKETVEEGTEFTLPETTNKKEGYFFAGWQSDDDGHAYSAGSKYKITCNVTFKETWVQKSTKALTVTFADEYGNKIGEQIIDEGANPVITLPDSITKRIGYEFVGWEDDYNWDLYKVGASYTVIRDVTFCERWEWQDYEKGMYIRMDEDAYYQGGAAVTPYMEVYYNGESLTAGTDYTVKYKNNKNAGEATLTVTGKNNFAGAIKKDVPFTIKPVSIDSGIDDYAPSMTVIKDAKVSPILTYMGKQLKLGKDFTIAGEGLSDKGKYTEVTGKDEKGNTKYNTLKATGINNFSGTLEIKVAVIDKKDAKGLAVDIDKNFKPVYGEDIDWHALFNGKTETVGGQTVTTPRTITVYEKGDKDKTPLTLGTNYTYAVMGDTTKVGTVKFMVVGMGEYSGMITKSFKISPKPLASDEIEISARCYDEKNGWEYRTDNLTAVYSSAGSTLNRLTIRYKTGEENGKPVFNGKLYANRDYKVAYSGNKKVGTGKAKITFINDYKGTPAQTVVFTITGASLNDTYAIAPDMIYAKAGKAYASKPLVEDGSTIIKASEYVVSYGWASASDIKKDGTTQYTDGNKITLKEGDDYAEVKVTITPSAKSNYVLTQKDNAGNGIPKTTYYYVRKADNESALDLSKAKVEFFSDKDLQNQYKKIPYCGSEFYTPEGNKASNVDGDGAVYVKVTVNKTTVVDPSLYDVVWLNATNKGKATVVIVGKGPEFPAADKSFAVGGKTAGIAIDSIGQWVEPSNSWETFTNFLKSIF